MKLSIFLLEFNMSSQLSKNLN